MRRLFLLLTVLVGLAACTDGERDLAKPLVPLGDFKLGHSIVIAPNLTKGPVSRDATEEEWIAALEPALDARFKRYSGDKFYHLGISVEGYVLAQPGIPLVLSPKSVLILRVTVWDDKAGKKLNEEAHQITVLETISGETVVGSGLTQTKRQQMKNLSVNAALLIERWMRKMHKDEGWFGPFEEDTAEEVSAEDPAPAG